MSRQDFGYEQAVSSLRNIRILETLAHLGSYKPLAEPWQFVGHAS